MTDNRAVGQWFRDGLVALARGLVLVVLSAAFNGALFALSIAAIVTLPLGIGLILLPAVTGLVREYLTLLRRLLGDWTGVEIRVPYRIRREGRPFGFRYCRHLLADPATWRDLSWLVIGIPVGIVLGALPGAFLVYGLQGALFVAVLLYAVLDWYGYGVYWPMENFLQALASVPQGFLLVAAAMVGSGFLMRVHALFARTLLGPTTGAALAQRVRDLAASRSETVDASAAELRRIERDLHDGAQARLVALSMSIGLAEQLLHSDPAAAQRLMAEARESSGKALVELRDLVRGIHPPVLAERGLDGAVRALALAVPFPVDVHIDLPARPEAPVESAAYFAVAEALANVSKHSRATTGWIRISYGNGVISLLVGDDGIGGAAPAPGSGLRGMERRLGAFDGTMRVTSPPGGPTVVAMELPCVLSSPKTAPSSGTG